MENLCLCASRHPMPDVVTGSIFETDVNPLDVDGLEHQALRRLQPLKGDSLNLYVTGLTVALIAALNACYKLDIDVTLKHFDRNSNTYYSQKVR